MSSFINVTAPSGPYLFSTLSLGFFHHSVNELEAKLQTLQQHYAELNTAIFEAAQVHRRLCAPSSVHYGTFDIASEIFAVRHLPGDFFTVEETRDGMVLALGDIGGKGLAAGMWVSSSGRT